MTTLGDALERIRQERGQLNAAIVVDEARPENSELHRLFEWDDHRAGELYRLGQAATLIRSVTIVDRRADGSKLSTRKYWPVRGEAAPTTSYEPLPDLLADPVQRQLLLGALERDWQAFRRRWENVSEFVAVVQRGLINA